LESLIREAYWWRDEKGVEKLDTLYFGGGTPSMLSPSHLQFLVEGLAAVWDLTTVQEPLLVERKRNFSKN